MVYAWRHGLTKTAIDAAVRNNVQIMLCPGEHCYLDYPEQKGDMPEVNWGMPVTSLEQTYKLDPAWGQDDNFVRNTLLGVSGTLWSESINSTERLFYQTFHVLRLLQKRVGVCLSVEITPISFAV